LESLVVDPLGEADSKSLTTLFLIGEDLFEGATIVTVLFDACGVSPN